MSAESEKLRRGVLRDDDERKRAPIVIYLFIAAINDPRDSRCANPADLANEFIYRFRTHAIALVASHGALRRS